MENKVALVTGAAGGISAAVVPVLAEHGVKVAAVDLAAEPLKAATETWTDDGLDVRAFPADVTSGAAVGVDAGGGPVAGRIARARGKERAARVSEQETRERIRRRARAWVSTA